MIAQQNPEKRTQDALDGNGERLTDSGLGRGFALHYLGNISQTPATVKRFAWVPKGSHARRPESLPGC